MKKRMNKRGQFYLIAAIIIIMIIIGFATIMNYSKKKSSIKVFDLKDELNIESEKVLDFGKINQATIEETNLTAHFTTVYNNYLKSTQEQSKNVYFIFGNIDTMVAYSYGDVTVGTISVGGGGGPTVTITERLKNDLKERLNVNPDTKKVSVNIPGLGTYEFDLKPGENFYFIISEKSGGEQYVVPSS